MLKRIAGVLAAEVCMSTVAMTAAPGAACAQTASYTIPAGGLGQALDAWARQSGRQVIYRSDDLRGARSRGARGALSADAALQAVLAGSGFAARPDASGAVAIIRAGEAHAGSDAAEGEGAEITVTGTNIRGVTPRSSPITVIDRTEMDARGVATAEQLINSQTQNFNSVNSSGIAAIRSAYVNADALNSVDLRGLGPGTTLVLLDGRRLSASSNGTAVDISMIPLAAIDRVEILTDSASSVYGSDAVGGVVNFVLRDSFQGLEASAAYGSTLDGAHDEFRGSLTGGINWSTGNVVASASYLTRSPLSADERDFSRGVLGRYFLVPSEDRYNAFLSGRQDLADNFTIHADGVFSRRTSTSVIVSDGGIRGGIRDLIADTTAGEAESYFGALGATWEVSDALIIDLTGSYSRTTNHRVTDRVRTIGTSRVITTDSANRSYDIGARVGGRLLSLPGGYLAYSIGGGFTRESLYQLNTTGIFDLSRTTRYAFGELQVPILAGLAGINRLEANLSARYSDYSDFGSDFSPKIGLLWSVTPGFNLRGSYGRTFRAPYLTNISEIGFYQLLDPVAIGGPSPVPGNPNPIGLYLDAGAVPDLGPETSKLLALGMDLRPPSVPGLAISFTYVGINYRNRISRGDTGRGTGYLFQPELYPELFNLSPTREDIATVLSSATFSPGNVSGFDQENLDALVANVDYIVDNRLRNIAQSSQDAVDFSISYVFAAPPGDISLGANVTYILDYRARTAPSSAAISQVNELGKPVDLRASFHVGLASGGFAGRMTANYVSGYENPTTPAFPHIDSWLTFDLAASYSFPAASGLLHGLSLHFVARNLLDSDPPYVADVGSGVNPGLNEPIGHDPANASPVGRFVSIELRKRF